MPNRMYLTDRSVQSLKPVKKDCYIWDTKLAGFALRQWPSKSKSRGATPARGAGGKSWVIYCYHDGKTTKTTLGRSPQMNAETARMKARALLLAANIPEEVETALNIPTFAEFVANHWQADCKRMKPSTQIRTQIALNCQLLPRFGDMRLDQITRQDTLKWFDHYSRTAPGGANRTLDVLRQIFIAAMRFDLIAYSPAKGIIPNKRGRPMRVLSKDEIARLHQVLDAMRPRLTNTVDIIRMLLLTGCRAGEIRLLHWQEVKGNRLTLEDSKTGPRVIWISAVAEDLLKERRRERGVPSQTQELAREYVFPSAQHPNMPCCSLTRSWHIIRKMARIDGVRLHDLRHSFASHAIRSGLPVPVIQKLLGHSSPVMTMRYIHYADDDIATAAIEIGEKLQSLITEGEGNGIMDIQ